MRIPAEDREWLTAEITAVIEQLPPTPVRHAYSELLTAVDTGEVPDDLREPLSRVLAVGLESNRIRRLHGAHAEQAAARLYARTPAGQALSEAVAQVNQALAGFAGAVLREISFAGRGPGRYSLTLRTDRGDLNLVLDRQGMRVQSAEVG